MRTHLANFQALVYFSFGAIAACLVSCGGNGGPAAVETHGSRAALLGGDDCGGAAAQTRTAYLGGTASFLLSPPGAKAPFVARRTGYQYFGDESGGLQFASDSFPLEVTSYLAATAGTGERIELVYEVRTDGIANEERRYALSHPGSVKEKFDVTDSAGKVFHCEVVTNLR